MAIADIIGAAVTTGGQTTAGKGTFANWTVIRATTGDVNVDSEDLENEDGALLAMLIYKRHPKIVLSLESKNSSGTETQAIADFPMGNMCTLTGLTSYYCDSTSIVSSKSVVRVDTTLILKGIT